MDNIRIAKVDNVTLDRLVPPSSSSSSSSTPSPLRQTGTLHLTPHHLIFHASQSSSDEIEEVWISYPSITLLTRLPQTFAGKYPLQIRTRSFESYVLGFERAMEGGAEDVWLSVKDCAVAASVEQLYAFFYTLPPPVSSSSKLSIPASSSLQTVSPLESSPQPLAPASASSGWSTFNPRLEFARQGVGSRTKAWRFTDINKDYGFSPTYPAKMVVPSRISDSTLVYAGKYRSKGRIPALTYLHWANQASMTRSSQPMVGLKNARSAQDERLVECIFTSHLFLDTAYTASTSAPSPNPLSTTLSTPAIYGATTTNLIVDARPTANAMANVAIGAGTENMENYKAAKKAYLGIDNIHVMRNSLKIISEAIRDAETPSVGSSTSSSSAAPLDRALLRKSNWLKHISAILDGSLLIIKNIHLNASHVLVHCSDGWDRTAQLCAVAQLCLDPYYRTIDGFKVLIEKDWLAFGHKFLDRSGHLSNEKLFTVTDAPDEDSDDEGGGGGGAQRAAQAFFASVQNQFKKSDGHLKEVSPVFHQFLDCVRQIQRQYPDRFEYTEQFLLDIYTHLYSCQFGTFLFNNERERRASPPDGAPAGSPAHVDRTVSAWEWFERPEVREAYVNAGFDASLDDPSNRKEGADQGVLMFDPRDVRWWFRLFRRGDEEMNGPSTFQAGQPGADMVIIPPGQVDPVSAEGLAQAVVGSGDGVVGAGALGSASGSRGPSPAPPRTRAGDRALAGPSGKGTYRGIESTSSAFSLQTAGHPTPNPDSGSGLNSSPSFPSSGLPSARNGNRNSAPPSSSGAWGWTQFSSGAYSALSRGAREIRTIGEGAINQIRAEVGEYDAQSGQEMGGPGTGIGEGRPGAARAGVRLPSQANPWSTGGAEAELGGGGLSNGLGGVGASRPTPVAPASQSRDNNWNTNPWGDNPTPSRTNVSKSGTATPTTSYSNSAHPRPPTTQDAPAPSSVMEEGTRHSLADLSLAEGQGRAGGGAKPKPASQSERELLEAAMGGDMRAWDPLGAA